MAFCELVDFKFALYIQGAILLVILILLVLKKKSEEPARLWRVFILDVSKQIFGAGCAQALDLLLPLALGNDSQTEDEACTWYWISTLADTTVGVLLVYLLLKVVTKIAECLTHNLKDFHTGLYMDANGRIVPSKYFKQLAIWFWTIVAAKAVITLCFAFFQQHLFDVAVEILRPVKQFDRRVELALIMIVTPCVMKAIQFWITDSFLKQGGVTFRDCGVACCHCARWACTGGLCKMRSRSRARKREAGRSSCCCCFCCRRHGSRSLVEHDAPLLQTKSDELQIALAQERRRVDQLERALKKSPPPEALDELRRTQLELQRTQQELLKTQEMLDDATERCQTSENDVREQLYKSEQLLRLSEQEKQTLLQQLFLAKEIEHQLRSRVNQLEHSYAAAGTATRAVLAAETAASAAAKAAARNVNAYTSYQPTRKAYDAIKYPLGHG